MTLREETDLIEIQMGRAIGLLICIGLVLGYVLVPLGSVERESHSWLVTYGILAIGSATMLLIVGTHLRSMLRRLWNSPDPPSPRGLV